tara:strand:- start:132623 stop:133687 length:1065 start_codon:yes stop_codon:yes gene_type:complete
MPIQASYFRKKLIKWYLQNKRDLPWRSTKDPYFIWLSEIMLQQTRVAQGLPYYFKFTKAFPTIHDLANASEDKILKLWQGLGYYSRARNLHFTAKYISRELKGDFPATFHDLLKLKGVGDYTASAIASICFDKPTAVVDGNVYRVLSRFFGIDTPINSSKGIKEFKALAQQLIDKDSPGTFNQAIMEFGARFCIPQNPNCSNCIFNDSCVAYSESKVSVLPVKIKKLKVRKRYFNYIVFLSENEQTLLRQRTERGIWQKLYEFPLVETTTEVDAIQLKNLQDYQELEAAYNIESLILFNEDPVIHKLSHQHLYTRFWIAEVSEITEKSIPVSMVRQYAVPVLIENFIAEFSEFN